MEFYGVTELTDVGSDGREKKAIDKLKMPITIQSSFNYSAEFVIAGRAAITVTGQ